MRFCGNPECPGHVNDAYMCDFMADKPSETEVHVDEYRKRFSCSECDRPFTDITDRQSDPCIRHQSGNGLCLGCNTKINNPNKHKRVQVKLQAKIVSPQRDHKTGEVVGYNISLKIGRDRPLIHTTVPKEAIVDFELLK